MSDPDPLPATGLADATRPPTAPCQPAAGAASTAAGAASTAAGAASTAACAAAPAVGEADSLDRLRGEIDALDERLAGLLQARAALSLRVGRAKSHASAAPPAAGAPPPPPPAAAIFVPEREAEVLAHVQEVPGPLDGPALAGIYREILSTSRALQRRVRVAHLGPSATYGHQAALVRFGHAAELVPCQTHADVFLVVEKGAADYGLVAYENSTEGPVSEVLDRLVDTPLQACAEVALPVEHALVGHAASLAGVRRVLCHPQAAAQARGWLAEHLPGVPVEPASSNGRAAELASTDPSGATAAVAPRIAADVFGLRVLAESIQDLPGNVTRFLVLARAPSDTPTGRDKTAVVFSIRDRVGALRDLTHAFASNLVNLSSIQSRPSRRRAWDYVFFIELDGHVSEPRVRRALSQAEEHTVFLKVLGSWPVPRD